MRPILNITERLNNFLYIISEQENGVLAELKNIESEGSQQASRSVKGIYSLN